jgi:ubiquinone biosynthesis protein
MIVTGRIHSTIRNTRRLTEIMGVLIRHGFSGAVAGMRLGEAAGVEPREAEEAPGTTRLSTNERLRHVLEELGPVFIKLGQVLSTRPDLIPADMADEFRSLQVDAPKVPFDVIKARLEEEFDDLDAQFGSIEPDPIGAASMAQVHRATLPDGRAVVLKVLRPGIESIIDSDMEILGEVARFAERYFENQAFSPADVVREFSKQLSREIDFTIEARSTERLGRQFADDETVSFPRVYREHSTKRVLTLEEVQGKLLSRLSPDELSPEIRRRVVENGTTAVFQMCLVNNFFHADPHPGNIFVLEGGNVCFIDCGMTGRIEERTANQLSQFVYAVVDGDVDTVIRTALDLSGADQSLQFDRRFRNDVSNFIGRFEVTGGSLEELELGAVLMGFFDLLREWRVRCPSDVVFLLKALITIEGVGREVDPTFDLVTHVRPMLQRRLMKRYSLGEIRRRLIRNLSAYVDILEDLPGEIRSLTSTLHRKDFAVNLHHQGLNRLSDTLDQASRTVAYSLVIAAVILSAAVLILADRGRDGTGLLTQIGFAVLALLFLGAGAFALLNFWRIRRGAKRPRRRRHR